MKRIHIVTTILIVLSSHLSVQENSSSKRDFSQPARVFIATTDKWAHSGSAREAVLIYLEEAMSDHDGDLLVEVTFNRYETIFGEIDYPPSSKKWYFVADWKITTKGSGYLFRTLTRKEFYDSYRGSYQLN
jgi:hypothetical protein